MAVYIGHASISEKGTIDGAKGDSTKFEVCKRTWYNHPFDFMAIHPDESVREKHAQAVEAACNNDNIGYGQSDRNTLNTEAKAVKYDLSKITKKCNCDCSSLQNVAAVASGANGVTYGTNGWTTRTMESNLKAAGYIIIDDPGYLTSSTYCVRGAIYVKAGSHTVTGLNNGSKYSSTLKKAGLTVSKKVSYFKKYTGTSKSLVTALDSIDVNSAFEYRKKIAVANSIKNYKGTATQNTKLLSLLKQGALIKP